MGALLAGVVIALVVYLATGGHVIFLPLFFLLPLGLFALGGKRRRTRGWRRFP